MKSLLQIFLSLLVISCQTRNIPTEEKNQVIKKLEDIAKIDQEFAGVPSNELKEKYGSKKAWEIFKQKKDSIAIENQKQATSLYKRYGFIGIKNFNKEASKNFWLIIQHADNNIKLQERVLKMMTKEIAIGNAEKSLFAMLEDRVHVNQGKKQRFATQVTYNEKGQAIPKNGLSDSINIEKIRYDFGLPTFKEYYNDMTEMHFEMNKEYYNSQGINEPQLYQ